MSKPSGNAPEVVAKRRSLLAPELNQQAEGPIVDHDANAPEVIQHTEYGGWHEPSAYQAAAEKHDHYGGEQGAMGQKSKKILGLRPITFWLVLALIVVVLGAAIGGGVGGSLAGSDKSSQNVNSGSTTQATAESATTAPGSSATSAPQSSTPPSSSQSTQASSSTATGVTSGTTGLAALSCTDDSIYTTSSGNKYQEFCYVNWPAGLDATGNSDSVEDVDNTITYTFSACMDACDKYNKRNDGGCNAVTYDQNLTTSVSHNGGNCVLKSAQGATNPAYDEIASAALLFS